VARTPAPRVHYDLEITRLATVIAAVMKDECRGEEWKASTLDLLRRARENLAQAPPTLEPTRRKPTPTNDKK
jgi:hypothetical protein